MWLPHEDKQRERAAVQAPGHPGARHRASAEAERAAAPALTVHKHDAFRARESELCGVPPPRRSIGGTQAALLVGRQLLAFGIAMAELLRLTLTPLSGESLSTIIELLPQEDTPLLRTSEEPAGPVAAVAPAAAPSAAPGTYSGLQLAKRSKPVAANAWEERDMGGGEASDQRG